MPHTPVPPDVPRIRLDNAHALFDEFVRATVKHPDAATLRGLEGRFAERLQIQPSYWSQIKSRSRQIGERLARQFERLCHKPPGWMDVAHGASDPPPASRGAIHAPAEATATGSGRDGNTPQDDDERFIVGLVLTYYRRHPQRARTRLLDLLGEVLTMPAAAPPATSAPTPRVTPANRTSRPAAAAGATTPDDEQALWARTRSAVAPLKQKR
jgi:hypothetical protein